MSDVRDLIIGADAEFKCNTYAEISEEILTKLLNIVTEVIHITPLAGIALEYARLDSFGLFMHISAIHMKGINVTPVGTEYNVSFDSSSDRSQLTVIERSKYINGHNCPDSCANMWKYIFEPASLHSFVCSGDSIAIGSILKVAMNKPWWTTKEMQKMGTASILSLTNKAKLMLWRFMRRGM